VNGGDQQRFTEQVFGQTFNGAAPPLFNIARSVVPSEYEVAIQILEATTPVQVVFGLAPDRPRTPDQGGFAPDSIAVLEGPNPRLGTGGAPSGCAWQFGGGSTTFPAMVRMRFRVDGGLRQGARC
jgi:hypothetical protein